MEDVHPSRKITHFYYKKKKKSWVKDLKTPRLDLDFNTSTSEHWMFKPDIQMPVFRAKQGI